MHIYIYIYTYIYITILGFDFHTMLHSVHSLALFMCNMHFCKNEKKHNSYSHLFLWGVNRLTRKNI